MAVLLGGQTLEIHRIELMADDCSPIGLAQVLALRGNRYASAGRWRTAVRRGGPTLPVS